MNNPVTEILGSKYPILQGAMGHISNAELVAAVSEAGGYGLLAAAFWDKERLADEVAKTKELTDKPFGANLVAWRSDSLEMVKVIADAGIRAVTTSAGDPKLLVDALHEAGVKVLHVVPSAALAIKAQAAGVDAVIAEGGESGGIQGPSPVSTLVLIPAVVDAVDLPVVAAGGIADKRTYRAAMALGASGVQVGTVFMASEECCLHDSFKKLIVDSDETDTVVIAFEGRIRVRALRTPYSEKLASGEGGPRRFTGRWGKGVLKGDVEGAYLPAGQAVGLIRSIKSVKEIISEMVS